MPWSKEAQDTVQSIRKSRKYAPGPPSLWGKKYQKQIAEKKEPAINSVQNSGSQAVITETLPMSKEELLVCVTNAKRNTTHQSASKTLNGVVMR